MTDAPPRLPSRVDPIAARATAPLGGVWGSRAAIRTSAWWTPLRVLLAMTMLTLVLGFAQKSPCANGNWVNTKQYTHMCYSDVVPLWNDERLSIGGVPYRDTAVEYPALTGGFMWFTAEITHGLQGIESRWSELIVFVVVTSLLLAACGLVVTAATAQTARRRPYDAALFALSPLLVFHAYSNWDLLAMALLAGAMWAWAKGKPVAAGVLIGLGTAAKLYPLFLLVAIGLLAIRTRRLSGALWCAGAAVAAWITVNVPVALAYKHGWEAFYTFSFDRSAERSTVWAIVKTMANGGLHQDDAVYWVPPGAAVALTLFGALLLVTWLGLFAPTKPRLAQLAFLVVLAFLLTTKVWSPQYSLWLVPLLALARPRWRLSLVWQFCEIAVWFATLTVLLGPSDHEHSIAYGGLVVIILVRDVLLLALAGLIVRDMWHPESDLVRADGSDDPGGGEFDGAPDYFARVPGRWDLSWAGRSPRRTGTPS